MTALVELESEQIVFSVITEQERTSITDEIICGKTLKFKYINSEKLIELIDSKSILKEKLSHFDILKYNYNQIFTQIIHYFPDIKINKFENSPCANECANFNIDSTYKFDIYMILTKEDKSFEYGFDFFSSNLDNEENKYEHSKILLDNYEYFYSEDINSNEDIKYYLNETLFKLMVAICSIRDDEYKLAEILFTRVNKDKMDLKLLIKELGYFLKIINWKKLDLINLEDLYDDLQLIDNKTKDEINLKDFKKTIKNICDDNKIQFEVKNQDISFKIFELFLLNNIDLSSRTLMFYKKSYQQSISMLMESLKLIIQLTNEINMRKKFFSRYINFLIEFKLGDYKNQNIFNKIYLEKINDKKELFEKIFNQINVYCKKNKHCEDKLDKIKLDFDSLYDNVFTI
jgi:hypothetical protein